MQKYNFHATHKHNRQCARVAYRSGVKVSSVWMTVSGAMSSSLSVFQSALSSDRM